MLLGKGNAQTKCIKSSADKRRRMVLNHRPPNIVCLWLHSITTCPMKVKGLAVVDSAIFQVLKSKNLPHKIPYSTMPVKKLSK